MPARCGAPGTEARSRRRGEGDGGAGAGEAEEDGEEAIEAEGDAGGWRHPGLERREELLVQVRDGEPGGPAGGPVRLVAPPLLGRIGQLVEGVRQLDPARVELEAEGHREVGVFPHPGEGGLARRVLGEDRRALPSEARFDPVEEDAEEQVVPGVRRVDGEPEPAHLRREGLPLPARGEVDPGVPGERLPDGQPFEGEREVRSGGVPGVGAGGLGEERQQLLQVADQRLEPLLRPVPLDHRELGQVPGASLVVPEHPGDLVDPRGGVARGREGDEGLLEMELGTRDQPAPLARGEGHEMRLEPGADDPDRRLHVQEPALVEEGPQGGEDPGPGRQHAPPFPEHAKARGQAHAPVAAFRRHRGATSSPAPRTARCGCRS